MRANVPTVGDSAARPSHEEDRHTPFLMYRRFFYLKVATVSVVVAIILYLVDVPLGEPYGGTWAGYILGTAGALLILWLMWFGYRKRSYRSNQGKLEAWLSAHVYLGIALLFIATLHTGFHFGWNIHTAAYALMCIVIASGAFGIYCYVHYPRLITDNRGGITMPQILGRIAVVNDELRAGAMTVDDATARLVNAATERTAIGGSKWQQISGKYPDCTTAKAIESYDGIAASVVKTFDDAVAKAHEEFAAHAGPLVVEYGENGARALAEFFRASCEAIAPLDDAAGKAQAVFGDDPAKALIAFDQFTARKRADLQGAYRKVRVALDEKSQLLARARRDISYKGMMDIWLYFHVPVSFALLATLFAHVVSVFFYW